MHLNQTIENNKDKNRNEGKEFYGRLFNDFVDESKISC